MYEWIDDFALAFKGTTKDFQPAWNAERFKVGDKMFAMKCGDNEGKPILSMKCEPDEAVMLREKYPDIVPGYYCHKKTWNSVYLEGAVSREEMCRMLENAYSIMLHSLPKKTQAAILGD